MVFLELLSLLEEASRSNESYHKTSQGSATLLTRGLVLLGCRCSSLGESGGCGGRLCGGSLVVRGSGIFLENTTLECLGSTASDG